MTETIEYNYSESIERSAAMLDESFPNWYLEIDLDSLDMGCLYNCVLGQLWNTYSAGEKAIQDAVGYEFVGEQEGFEVHPDDSAFALTAYGRMTRLWRAEIDERLTAFFQSQR